MRMNRQSASAAAGLSGAIVLIGLALAFAGGGFNLTIFFIALAISSLVGSLRPGNPRALYGGFMGFCWLLMLALFFWTGSWVWFLVGAAISALMGTFFKQMIEGLYSTPFFQNQTHYQPQAPYQPPAPPIYQPYEQGYQRPESEGSYQEGGKQYYYPPSSSQPSYSRPEMPEAEYPQQLPPQQ